MNREAPYKVGESVKVKYSAVFSNTVTEAAFKRSNGYGIVEEVVDLFSYYVRAEGSDEVGLFDKFEFEELGIIA